MQAVIADVTQEFNKIGKYNFKGAQSLQHQLNVTSWDQEWVLVEENVYLIQVQLLDKESNPIILTKNL